MTDLQVFIPAILFGACAAAGLLLTGSTLTQSGMAYLLVGGLFWALAWYRRRRGKSSDRPVPHTPQDDALGKLGHEA